MSYRDRYFIRVPLEYEQKKNSHKLKEHRLYNKA